ncbi:MAG TPA: hypothetical protein DDY21_00195 [Candidatus Moranbacteria bacterium]|nr:hypothetical protein [Candidatus Moranbacteria bacterium]
MEIKCPITNEVILKITPNGIIQRVNYCEVWFSLDDGSQMKVAMSKNAKKNLKKSQTDELFSKINIERRNKILAKVITKEKKEEQLSRIDKSNYSDVKDKIGILVKIDKNEKI